ncbi:adenylate cyclase type 10-like [Plodia interpunctella]|uniref:adenylate cyclase type 10-like n=1 Tax=Plodia interpunctella TaxID=58824 RepID=UPI002367699F|nr:adenylate cyclase type 10-like [Plodia interpunctella]
MNIKKKKIGAATSSNPKEWGDEYLMAMKRAHQQSNRRVVPKEMKSPRERRRRRESEKDYVMEDMRESGTVSQGAKVSNIASMVPDEIIYYPSDYSVRSYDGALMFIDVSGFTELCESYTKPGRGGPSRLTQVLNSYIGAMVQEIMAHNGDVLKFSGDAFLSLWKKTPRTSMQEVVHTAIDCGLIIQKNYGTFTTDIGVILKVKVAISAGHSHFSIIGGDTASSQAHYVMVGQPVWDVKMAQYMSTAGDVLTSASAWIYVNEAEYCTQPCGDGRHTKVLGVGATWKRVENGQMPHSSLVGANSILFTGLLSDNKLISDMIDGERITEMSYREFSLRPAIVSALRSSWWPALRRFMVTPVLRAVDNDEPMDFLTEVRRVVVVFLNIITRTVTEDVLINIVDNVYKFVCSLASEAGGLVNKVSMFDKDMMFLVVFGLRGLKHEQEAQKALLCAYQLKAKLDTADSNIISVSIGVTSGTTYCGVVGHVLRREYTVIGPAVNKAARLMMVYPYKLTCDKETFLRSKLEQEYFKLVEPKIIKGIASVGPIYEFNLMWSERLCTYRHPLLGRNDELRRYKMILLNALNECHEKFTSYKNHKFGVAFIGSKMIGKRRLVDECLRLTPSYMQIEKIDCSDQTEKVPFWAFRKIMSMVFTFRDEPIIRQNFENMIRHTLDSTELCPLELHALNTIFDMRFPLPEKFTYSGDILTDYGVKNLLRELIKTNFQRLWILTIYEAQNIDDESWRLMLLFLESKTTFIVMTISEETKLTNVGLICLKNHMIVNFRMSGVDRWYHAAMACQLLDVQAIPADLEKVIECASGGVPGWIQNFLISLVQRGVLSIVTVSRSEAVELGAIMPPPQLLQRTDDDENYSIELPFRAPSYMSIYSIVSVSTKKSERGGSPVVMQTHDTDTIQMAVLAEGYSFLDMSFDMTMDAVILKTYDSLTPFEKMLLKCGSVLGDVFSRRMLLYLLQTESHRIVAQGTFLILLRPPLFPGYLWLSLFCSCLGTRQPPDCRDLPLYAFCGYMRFRHSLFRTTTYELLTESQKHEMHYRALMFLERYTRRCSACGSGCFVRLLGLRTDDGLRAENEELKRTRQQIRNLSAETRVAGDYDVASVVTKTRSQFSIQPIIRGMPGDFHSDYDSEEKVRNTNDSIGLYTNKQVRSFSSLELGNCECLAILLSVYCQIIDHCKGANQNLKLYEAYMEYIDLSILKLNIPQAIRLLYEVETFVKTAFQDEMPHWINDFRLASIHSLRGMCMLESGDLGEAREQFFTAMKLYRNPFPETKFDIGLSKMKIAFHQVMAMSVAPQCYHIRDPGYLGYYYEDLALTLNRMYRLFLETKEEDLAILAAKWSYNYALRTNANFRILCNSYGNMIAVYRQKQKFSMCRALEKRVMELCHRKRGQLDVTEVQAVCYLYTALFLFFVEYGKKMESIMFGLSVMRMMSSLTDLNTRQHLILWMLKFLLSDLRIQDMVAIMREFFYMVDHYDLSSETWYYFYAIIILLDTGYCVEPYSACEKFYIKKGDAILRSKSPEAAWNYFVGMWLITIRIGAWERSILWEEKIKKLQGNLKYEKYEFGTMIVVRLLEGMLITLVREMSNRNIKKTILLEDSVSKMLSDLKTACNRAPMFAPRYYLLLAYFDYIRGKKMRAFSHINKSIDLARTNAHAPLMYWGEHTRDHWKGTLPKNLENYWIEHVEPDNLLDYRDFDPNNKIVPYTLPLPKDLES